MRLERWKSMGWAVFLAMAAVLGGIGCMITAFSLEDVILPVLLLSWSLAAVVFALCRSFRVSLYPLLGLGLLGGYLWQSGPLRNSMERLLWFISDIYDRAYDCGVLCIQAKELTDVHTTTALCWLGLLIVFAVVRSVIDRRGVWLAVLLSALPLVSCLVVTDTVPAVSALFSLLLAVVLLMMTQSVRRREERQGNRLTGLLLLPVALALGLLFLLIPQEGYNGQAGAAKLEALVLRLFQGENQIPTFPQLDVDIPLNPNTGTSALHGQKVYLDLVGPKVNSSVQVMRVTPARSGVLYLRGASYCEYTGEFWRSDPSLPEQGWPENAQLADTGTVTVETVSAHDVLYLPYYTDARLYGSFSGGMLENTDAETQYSFTQYLPQSGTAESEEDFFADMAPYLQLPEETSQWASPLVQQLLEGKDPLSQEAVQAIASYVRSSAVYDLDTPRMDSDYTDFAQWFLTQSDTGYCVHFASATAVLLRSAGIPARYVTGYMFSGTAGEQTAVLGRNAHAWVEYRLPGQPWKVLESTPADTQQDPAFTLPAETEPQDPLPPQTTAPDSTQPQIPTLPEQSTPTQTLPPEDPTTQPSEPEGPQPPSGQKPRQTWLFWLGITLLAAAAVPLQWRLRVTLKQYRRRKGRKNARALAHWQDIEVMSRLLGRKPDSELLELAQRARFSQHVLTAQELSAMSAALAALQSQLKQKSILHRLYYTLILALY